MITAEGPSTGQGPVTTSRRSLRPFVAAHPVTAFLVLAYTITGSLALVAGLIEDVRLPGGVSLYGWLENLLGAAVPAFAVTAIVSGREGARDLARRCVRWRVPARWYVIALLALPVLLLASATLLYGPGPMHASAANWLLLLTSFLPTLVVMAVLNSVAEEAGWTGLVFARLQDQRGPLRAALITTAFFWLVHLPGVVVETGSWPLAAALMAFLVLPHLASRLMVGWLYNSAGASVLIAGLFHATHNAVVNPTGFGVTVLELRQGDVLVIVSGLVVLAGLAVALSTRGRLGLPATTSHGEHGLGSADKAESQAP